MSHTLHSIFRPLLLTAEVTTDLGFATSSFSSCLQMIATSSSSASASFLASTPCLSIFSIPFTLTSTSSCSISMSRLPTICIVASSLLLQNLSSTAHVLSTCCSSLPKLPSPCVRREFRSDLRVATVKSGSMRQGSSTFAKRNFN